MRNFWFLFLITCGNSCLLYASCPIVNSQLNIDSVEFYLKTIIENDKLVEESCLSELIGKVTVYSKETAELVQKAIDRINNGTGIGNSILFSAYKNSGIFKNEKLRETIIKHWIRKNISPHEAFVRLVNNGSPAQADTLFSIFDALGRIDENDLISWANVKNVIGDYEKIPELFCRNLLVESNFQLIALNELTGILSELSVNDANLVLENFTKQCKPSKFQHSPNYQLILKWFIDSWGKFGSDTQLVNFVKENVHGSNIGEILSEIANDYFRTKKFKEAALVAKEAFEYAISENKDQIAQLAFQAWYYLNEIDSALIWIRKTKNISALNVSQAVALYQKCGDLESASKLIKFFPLSLNRDTLQIRQYIFNGQFNEALELLNQSKNLENAQNDFQLWKTRILLFSKDIPGFLEIVDSLRIKPQWSSSVEMLQYRYLIQMLNKNTDKLAVLATIEYNNFIGRPIDSEALLCSEKEAGALNPELLLRAVKEIIKQSPGSAVEFFERCKHVISEPDIIYYKAEALYLVGRTEDARKLFETILLDHPYGIYSGKARLLLSQMNTRKD